MSKSHTSVYPKKCSSRKAVLRCPLAKHDFIYTRIQTRHELWKKKYPDWPATRGPALTGLSNARSETTALSVSTVDLKTLPFDPLEYIEYDPPFDRNADPDLGQ